ncbi:MAG TPA: FAD-dependent monooxygenase [Burkholderiales bacterium]|jgi:salicylate hydroxylase|nr:FAD-dependent monooxygenase [Burkholderiales bacterium]
MKVVVVGAGVAGCIVARAVAAMPGVELVCLEQVAADDHSESGTGLNIGPNGLKALQRHSADLADAVLAECYLWHDWRISLTDGTVLFDLPLKNVADNPGLRIRWSELYRVLREQAGACVQFGCEVQSVGYNDLEHTFIEYTQGGASRRIDGIDLLISCDGRYSILRQTLCGVPNIKHVGVSILRLLVPDTSGGLVDDYEQWFNGPNRMLGFRVPENHIYLSGAFPIEPGAQIPDEMKTAVAFRKALTPVGGPPSAQCQWLIDTLCNNLPNIHWSRLQESPALFRDPGGRVMFLGDSANGMVPTLGQGATQAIEGACMVADLLCAKLGAGGGAAEVPAWLEEVEQRRRERIRFVMEFSLYSTDTMLAGADPVAGTRKKLEAPYMENLKRLYRDISVYP